ncbi:MAG: FAD:protein FMN transferase [Acidimicrobiia bacterium]
MNVTRRAVQLGTVVEVQVVGRRRVAREAADRALAEIERLEQVFSLFRTDSELNRWKRDEVPMPSDEMSAVMRVALAVQLESANAFNPLAGALTEVWRAAEAAGRLPDPDDLARVCEAIRSPRYEIDASGRPVRTGDCTGLNLHALAKGWIVDRAAEAAWGDGAFDAVLVNASGDLRHLGAVAVEVGIENPLRPYEGEPPLLTVAVAGAGLATSGRARQGFRIDGRWYGHVVDPRTGRTVDDVASVTVVAPEAATADATATVIGVESPDAALAVFTGTLRELRLEVAALAPPDPEAAIALALGHE